MVPMMMLACAIVGLGGCANAHRYRGLELSAQTPGALVALPGVAQDGKNDCGYAAMASVALYHRVEPQRLVSGEVPENFRGPALSAAELVKMAQKLGLIAFGYKGGFADLQTNVGKGRPVLVLLDRPPRAGQYPALEWFSDTLSMATAGAHWVVVVGFAEDGRVVLHDPGKGLLAMGRDAFAEAWRKRSHIAVLAVPAPPSPAGSTAAR